MYDADTVCFAAATYDDSTVSNAYFNGEVRNDSTLKNTWGTGDGKVAVGDRALSKAYPSHTNWGPGPKQGASCDVFVGTCVRNAGVAKKYPRGLAEQEKYLEKHFTRVKYSGDRKVLKDGDIGVMQYGSSGHTFIVVIKNGKLKICEANLRDTYPITVTSKSGLEWRLKKRSGRDYVHIFRAK